MAVCFIGHRTVENRDILYPRLFAAVEKLIQEGHRRFLLGSCSDFNHMAVAVLKELKQKYPHIERIYVRAEFPFINEDYRAHLLTSYNDTYFLESLLSAGKSRYVERNQHIIDESSVCVFYYQETYTPPPVQGKRNLFPRKKKSGTRIAYDFATKKGKKIINLYPS